MENTRLIGMIAIGYVIAAWLVFALVFLTRKRPDKTNETRRESAALFGIILQGVGFGLMWSIRRPLATPFVAGPLALHVALSIVAMALATVSIIIIMSALRTLGKQWAYAARIVTGHELITQGVYSRIRHPIYAGLLGMMIATGLVISRPWALAAALVFAIPGTLIRTRLEERLLTATFGDAYLDYMKRVPALVPSLGRK